MLFILILYACMFEAQIKVTLKKTVADPQGQTIKHALESFGFASIDQVRMGKFITVTLKSLFKLTFL